jgi:hypothetical protein
LWPRLHNIRNGEIAGAAAGTTVARVLEGSWRADPPAPDFDRALLDSVHLQLLASGAAGLVWRKIRGNYPLAASSASTVWRDMYRSNALNSARQQRFIVEIFARLTEKNLDAVLVKGWAMARLYPEAAARPVGDIDLYVTPEQMERARRVIDALPESDYNVDFEHLAPVLSGDSPRAMLERAEVVQLRGVAVRVLCAEDNLRMLAVHFLQHGGWRPLWLCDIAVALETRPREFDWRICLGANPIRKNWIESVMMLSHLILGARIEGTPIAGRAHELPRWVGDSILEKWGRLTPEMIGRGYFPRVGSILAPTDFVRAISHRWNDALRATVESGGSFDNSSRLWLKIKWGVKRARQLYAGRRSNAEAAHN